MPVGWSVSPPSSGSGALGGCADFKQGVAKDHPGHQGEVDFQDGDGIPQVVESVASWATVSDTGAAWSAAHTKLGLPDRLDTKQPPIEP